MTLEKVVMTDPKKPDYFYEESIKTLRTNIEFTEMDVKTIVFTSCFPNEGKSDVLFQLAREFGNIGKKVLVLDADIRKSSFQTRYSVSRKVEGLSQYLSGQTGGSRIIYATNYNNVDIIFAGPTAPNPSELLAQEAFAVLLRTVRDRYDYILIDTPQAGNMSDALVAAGNCDGAVLVIESNLVSRRIAAKAKEKLEMTGCRILGAVLNKVDVRRDKYYSKYTHYYYNNNAEGK